MENWLNSLYTNAHLPCVLVVRNHSLTECKTVLKRCKMLKRIHQQNFHVRNVGLSIWDTTRKSMIWIKSWLKIKFFALFMVGSTITGSVCIAAPWPFSSVVVICIHANLATTDKEIDSVGHRVQVAIHARLDWLFTLQTMDLALSLWAVVFVMHKNFKCLN